MIALPHAAARALERYGLAVTEADWTDVLLAITYRPPRAALLGTLRVGGL